MMPSIPLITARLGLMRSSSSNASAASSNPRSSSASGGSKSSESTRDSQDLSKFRIVRELKRYNVLGVRFDVDVRYSVLEVVGQGAYGVVCAAHDDVTNEAVAIKKISNAFEHTTYTKRTLREVRLLRLLQHENIIGLRTLLPPVKCDGFKDLYIISDLMETDLSSIIKSPQALSNDHVQFFIYQVLRGVKFLHSCVPSVTHRDLKPRNLLVNSNCDLKICDFGLARVEFELFENINKNKKSRRVAMTDYVATRWYRAPEIITGWVEYTKGVDMWAIGCVLAELLGRKPLLPGSDSQHQLELMCQLMGKPSAETVAKIETREIREYIASIPETKTVPFTELYPDACPRACDLLSKLLVFDPSQRCDVNEALRSPYLAQLHYEEDEPTGPEIPADAFQFELRDNISVDELRDEILHDIWCFHYDNPRKQLAPVDAEPFATLHERYIDDETLSSSSNGSSIHVTNIGGGDADAAAAFGNYAGAPPPPPPPPPHPSPPVNYNHHHHHQENNNNNNNNTKSRTRTKSNNHDNNNHTAAEDDGDNATHQNSRPRNQHQVHHHHNPAHRRASETSARSETSVGSTLSAAKSPQQQHHRNSSQRRPGSSLRRQEGYSA